MWHSLVETALWSEKVGAEGSPTRALDVLLRSLQQGLVDNVQEQLEHSKHTPAAHLPG